MFMYTLYMYIWLYMYISTLFLTETAKGFFLLLRGDFGGQWSRWDFGEVPDAAAVWNGIHESWHGENKPLTGIYIYMYNDLWWKININMQFDMPNHASPVLVENAECVCSQCSCAHISIWFWMYDASRALWPCLETQFDAQQTIPL